MFKKEENDAQLAKEKKQKELNAIAELEAKSRTGVDLMATNTGLKIDTPIMPTYMHPWENPALYDAGPVLRTVQPTQSQLVDMAMPVVKIASDHVVAPPVPAPTPVAKVEAKPAAPALTPVAKVETKPVELKSAAPAPVPVPKVDVKPAAPAPTPVAKVEAKPVEAKPVEVKPAAPAPTPVAKAEVNPVESKAQTTSKPAGFGSTVTTKQTTSSKPKNLVEFLEPAAATAAVKDAKKKEDHPLLQELEEEFIADHEITSDFEMSDLEHDDHGHKKPKGFMKAREVDLKLLVRENKLKSLTILKLKKILKSRNLSMSGRKPDLVARLTDYIQKGGE